MIVRHHAPFGIHFSNRCPARIQRVLWAVFGSAVVNAGNDNPVRSPLLPARDTAEALAPVAGSGASASFTPFHNPEVS